MDDHKKLEFIHKMAKLGLQQFAIGGGSGSTGDAINNNLTNSTLANAGVGGEIQAFTPSQGTPGQQNPYVQSNATNPNTGLFGSIAGGLGMTNSFQASSANITPGTNAQQLSDAYTGAQNALAGQQSMTNTLQPQVGSAVQNQNALANQYAAMARGQGPNPAQNQLAQATQGNVANQAALMAGQRGSSSNVGLMARQNAQQGAATQQQSAGQAATLGSQQQIAAQNNLASLANNQINQAGQANTNFSSQAQGEQGILQNANTGFNNTAVGMQSNINNVNSGTSSSNAAATGKVGGGALNLVSSLFAEGGSVDLGKFTPSPAENTPSASVASTSAPAASSDSSSGDGGMMSGLSDMMAKGGMIHSDHYKNHISSYFDTHNMKAGGPVVAKDKSEKAKVAGNSYSNDTIPALLSEGEVVIDRKTLADPGPIGQAARMLQAHLAQRNGK